VGRVLLFERLALTLDDGVTDVAVTPRQTCSHQAAPGVAGGGPTTHRAAESEPHRLDRHISKRRCVDCHQG
jgi:hypothetical protein